MSRFFLFPHIAQLFLKNHFEMHELANRLLGNAPYRLNLALGNGGATDSAVLNMTGSELHLRFQEGARTYELRVPLRAKDGIRVNVTVSEAGKQTHYDLSPSELLSSQPLEGFKGLHEKVLQYLKTLFPPSFFEASKVDAGAAPGQPSQEASAPAGTPSEADASTESPAAANPAPAEAAPPVVDEFKTYLVHRPNERNLQFRGKLLAAVESRLRNGRQFQYQVFETPSGKKVGLRIGTTMWLGECDRVQCQVADTLEDLVAFFGFDELAKALYARLGLSSLEVLE